MSTRAKSEAIKSNPAGGRVFSLFEQLGNRQNPEVVKERYLTALALIKPETVGLFTKSNGYGKSFEKWTPAMRRKVRRYYNDIKHLQSYNARTKQPMPRDKKAAAKAQKLAQHPRVIKGLKHLYVPGHLSYEPKIKFTQKGTPYRSDKYFNIYEYRFRFKYFVDGDSDLIQEECEHAWSVLMKLGGKRRFKFATLITGEYESFSIGRRIKSPEDLASAIMDLLEQYGDWGLWLRGILGYFSKPGSKVSQTLGSRSAIHLNDIEDQKTLRRKLVKADPERASMLYRRQQKELTDERKLSMLIDKLKILKEFRSSMQEDEYEKQRKKVQKEIDELSEKLTARESKFRKG